MKKCTLLFTLILESGSDDGTFTIDDDDSLNIFMSLHSVECLFDFWHEELSFKNKKIYNVNCLILNQRFENNDKVSKFENLKI